MSCRSHRSSLTDVALGEPASSALTSHLATCAGCRAVLDEERALLGGIDRELRSALEVTPSPELWVRARAAVARAAEEDVPRPWPWSWLALAAAAGVLCLVASAVWNTWRAAGREPRSAAVALRPPVSPSPVPQAPAAPQGGASVAPHERARPAEAARPATTSRPRPPREPLVLVPPGEEARTRLLLARLRGLGVEEGPIIAARVLPEARSERLEPLSLTADRQATTAIAGRDDPLEVAPVVIGRIQWRTES